MMFCSLSEVKGMDIKMNIYLQELKRNKRFLIIWSCVGFLLIVSQLAVFPSFYEDSVAAQEQLINKYPEALVKAFGLSELNMSDILNYYAVKIVPLVSMVGAIFAMILGCSILSKETSEKTIEFLLSKPVSRSHIITSKLFSVLTGVLVFTLVQFVGSFALMEKYKEADYSISLMFLMWGALLLLFIAFAVVGFFLSIFISKPKTVYSLSIGLVMMSYFFSVLSVSSEKLESLKFLSFFKYSDVVNIISDESMDPVYLFCYAVVIMASVILSYVFYSKKRIYV